MLLRILRIIGLLSNEELTRVFLVDDFGGGIIDRWIGEILME